MPGPAEQFTENQSLQGMHLRHLSQKSVPRPWFTSALPFTRPVARSSSSKMWTIVTVEIEEVNDGSNCFAFIHGATSLRRSVEYFGRWDPTICTGRHRDHPTT